jgi:alcohol dehydrogenase
VFPEDLLRHSPVEIRFQNGAINGLGSAVRDLNARVVLVVSDPGIRDVGHLARGVQHLRQVGVQPSIFDGAEPNPTTTTLAAGLAIARTEPPDVIVGLGGGSAMDCAKGINLLLTNGGHIRDYRGDPSPAVLAGRKPLLPMILIPTTAGTGSEAQSFALISDADTHEKLACGDRRLPDAGGLRPRVAILDPALTRTMPPTVAAATGMDAVTHAVETAGCRVRTELSRAFSRAAWERLSANFIRAVRNAADDNARSAMLLGAHLAGCAIEQSMLGAAHACANPLTAVFDITHGIAVGLMLPHVIRFNAAAGENPYADLDADPERLARHVEALLFEAELPRRLRDCGIEPGRLPALAGMAARQWTAGFNPRPVGAAELAAIYAAAL